MDIDENRPEPYRSPLGWNNPTAVHPGDTKALAVEVAIPNEDPDTEDDLTFVVKFTGEGIIIDGFVSSDQEIGTWAVEYDEIVGMLR